ncbi:MAG: hypothetical protein NTV51_15575 [Verrucomicrobia bacterium]|nr:hypothetical protein [Verrucomicrobiota bacterium]
MSPTQPPIRAAFAIFEDTLCQGMMPTWRDEAGFIVTYATEREAQIEIAEMLIVHLDQFIAGERDFDDARTTGDFILPVKVWPDGTIETEGGRRFGRQEI